MVRLIKKINESYSYTSKRYITEAKQVGIIYHVCDLRRMKFIAWHDNLQNGEVDFNKVSNSDTIPFTRDKRLLVDDSQDDFLFQIVIDGDKLSENYKIEPYSRLRNHQYYTRIKPSTHSYEECIAGIITDFSKYIKSVNFLYSKNFYKTINNTLEYNSFIKALEEINLYLRRFPTKRIPYPEHESSNIISDITPDPILDESLKEMYKFPYNISFSDFIKRVKELVDDKEQESIKGSSLADAIKDKDISRVRSILSNSGDPNYINEDEEIPIYIACELGLYNIMNLLIENGANPFILKDDNSNLFHTALDIKDKSDKLKVLELLVKNNVNINQRDFNGETPIFKASKSGDVSSIPFLMNNGANILIRNNYNQSPLDVAKDKLTLSMLKSKTEMKAHEIITKSDIKSKERSEHIRVSFEKIIDDEVYFTTTSQTYPNKRHVVILQCKDIDPDTDMESLKSIMKNKDIKIACSCEAFLYHGFKYISYHADAGIDPEDRPPNKTNPNRIGMACKHILAVLKYLDVL